MHWKRGKAKDHDEVSWGSPKQLQRNREYPNPNRGKRKRGVCHKTGEPHLFVVDDVRHYNIGGGVRYGYATLRCQNCQRSNTISGEKAHRYPMHPELIKKLLGQPQ